MKIFKLTAVALAMAVSAPAMSEEVSSISNEGPHFFMGYSLGGDDVGGLEYEDGSSADVTAGGGFTIGGGFTLKSLALTEKFNKDVGIVLEGSYKFDSATASNADVTMDRFVFSAMPYMQINETVKVAAGIEYHAGVGLTEEQDYRGSDTLEFDSAIGLAAELTFQTEENFSWSIKAVSVDYSIASLNGLDLSSISFKDIGGSNVGAFVKWHFEM